MTIENIIEAADQRSFGPVLLVTGLITLSPIGDVPGTPALVPVIVLLVCGQIILGRGCCWLPGWLYCDGQ